MRIATTARRGGSCSPLPNRGLTRSLLACLTLLPALLVADASAKEPQGRESGTTVTVMSGTTQDGNTTIVQDIAAVLDETGAFRVIPMVGQGPAQTLKDVMTLRGVDMGITQSTVLNHFARSGELGPIKDQVVYVAKLFNEDMHLLARDGIADIAALNGKSVNIGLRGSGTAIAARFLFSTLGVAVRETHFDAGEAVEKLKSGDIDAAVLIGTTPTPRIAEVEKASGLKLLAIPFAKSLEDDTYPAILTHKDYPALIAPGERVDTIAVCAVLITLSGAEDKSPQKADSRSQSALDGEVQDRLEKFVERFFSKFDALQEPPSNPKWRAVNFAATLEDWRRAPPAQAFIDEAKKRTLTEKTEKERFQAFLAQTNQGTPEAAQNAPLAEDQEKLFRAFKAWNARQASN